MTLKINDLSKYSREDSEKVALIFDVLKEFPQLHLSNKLAHIDAKLDIPDYSEEICKEYSEDYLDEYCDDDDKVCEIRALPYKVNLTKCCPKCGRKFPEGVLYCNDCLVRLNHIEEVFISDIESDSQFVFEGKNSYKTFEELLIEDNLLRIKNFKFNMDDYSSISRNIKSQALHNFDDLVKSNEIDFDSLDILDKILLFSKSFVKVDYKSYGGQLGYFEGNTIYIDDRQTDSLQITTLIHELSHFLIKEILCHVLCRVLDCSKNSLIDALITFTLSYNPFTQLIDEYSAHNVEGRFALFGFQDYSSYIQIESSLDGEMSKEEIEITKSIGNTFAISIKDILESLIDKALREEIKEQFLSDVLDSPNYAALKMENCQMLNDEGFIKALWLILSDGFEVAIFNIDKLKQIE